MKMFKELWDNLYRPGSMCPDVELAHIEHLMCNIIAKYHHSDLSGDAKWTNALIMLSPKSMSYIKTCWEYKLVDYYGSTFEEVNEQLLKAQLRAKKSVEDLVEADEIELVDDKYRSTNHSYH